MRFTGLLVLKKQYFLKFLQRLLPSSVFSGLSLQGGDAQVSELAAPGWEEAVQCQTGTFLAEKPS